MRLPKLAALARLSETSRRAQSAPPAGAALVLGHVRVLVPGDDRLVPVLGPVVR